MGFIAKAKVEGHVLGHVVVVLEIAVEFHVVHVLIRGLLVDAVDLRRADEEVGVELAGVGDARSRRWRCWTS